MAITTLAPSTSRALLRNGPRALLTRWMNFATAAKEDTSTQVAKASEDKSLRKGSPRGQLAPANLLDAPFRRMNEMMNQMQREMDHMMGSFGNMNPFALMDNLGRELLPPALLPTRRMIPLEVQEDEKSYSVKAELPGFTKDDIKVTLDPTTSTLTLTGEKNTAATGEGKEGKHGGGYRSSMYFQRTITLPQDVDVDQPITAKTEHGVLTLVLPKGTPKPHIKEIPVE